MILSHLDISNFRCLEKFSIDFFPGFNILIGRNGSGKSTLIHAIQKALSFIFSSDRSVSEEFLSAGIGNLNIRGFDTADFHFDNKKRSYALSASIRGVGTFAKKHLDWTLYKRNAPNASLYPSKYKVAFNTVITRISNGSPYPLLAYYSDSYPHRNVKQMQQALDIIKNDIMPRNFGYYQWDDESSCTAIWEKRLSERLARMLPLYTPAMRLASEELSLSEQPQTEEVKKRLAEIHESQEAYNTLMRPLYDETNFIEEKLKQFIKLLPGTDIEHYNISYLSAASYEDTYRLILNFTNGKTSTIADLPAGYRRLVSIVLDLAYRSYILNGHTEPRGIAIIDEIDLHLHPSLEEGVVNAFRECFRGLQFIVSTHSAAVISSLPTGKEAPENRIYVLKDGKELPEMLDNINGIDYNIVLRDFMDSHSRNNDIKALIDECLTFHAYGMTAEADTVYEQIVKAVGINNNVIRELNEKISNYKNVDR